MSKVFYVKKPEHGMPLEAALEHVFNEINRALSYIEERTNKVDSLTARHQLEKVAIADIAVDVAFERDELKRKRDELTNKCRAIVDYCRPHIDEMWAATIVGIIYKVDFRDAKKILENHVCKTNV